jgi:hypothetical protein
VATLVKPQARLPLLAAGLGAAALLLASCGGGGTAAPGAPVVTPTPLPAGEWISSLEADALWQEIAQSATLVKPILRPSYLPPGLTEVQRLDTEEPLLQFAIVYADARHENWLSLSAGSTGGTALSGPHSQQEQVVIRNTYATYQVFDDENPTADAWVLWQEPGIWGAPDNPDLPDLDHVPYNMSSHGLSRDDLIKIADSLQPVEE